MSGQATGWVLRHGPRPEMLDRAGVAYGARARGFRAVLVCVADAANRDGDHAHPGNEAICDGALYGRRQVSKILAELVADGWLAIEEQGGGKGRATIYRLPRMTVDTAHSVHGSEESIPRTLDSDTAHFADQTAHFDVDTARSGVRANGLVTEKPTKDSTAALDTTSAFELFWSAYPRRVGKPKAAEAFAKAVKRHSSEPRMPGAIVDGAIRFAEDPNREDEYTPHPTTWLNRDGWLDPPEPERRRGRPGRGGDVIAAARREAGIATDRERPRAVIPTTAKEA